MGEPEERAAAVAWLRSPEAARSRCHALLTRGERGALRHFWVDRSRLGDTADYVAAVIREAHPDLVIPYHARWRHFAAGGVDRWARLAGRLSDMSAEEIARIRIDLVVVSVLLDAGAGEHWCYREPETGALFARSEGLAVASLDAFRAGRFSDDAATPLRATAAGLARIDAPALAAALQAGPENPLIGIAGRAALLRRLGAAMAQRPDVFGADPPRPGGLFDALRAEMRDGRLPARAILVTILSALAPIWPGRIAIDGEALGDVWRHPDIGGEGAAAGLVPFHKLSQWLAYSLVEVFEEYGIVVEDLDALTGLPEYRNGGLFFDTGVIGLCDPALAETSLPVDHPAVVEWRALTLALLDDIAPPVRSRLQRSAAEMPLARILEGGTWAAGRRIAHERRGDGRPPLRVVSDGTVF